MHMVWVPGVWHFDQKLLEEEAWRKETPWSSRGGKPLKDQIRRRGATKRCGCLEGIAWRLGLCSSSRTDHVAWMHWEAVELVMLLLWLGVLVACSPLSIWLLWEIKVTQMVLYLIASTVKSECQLWGDRPCLVHLFYQLLGRNFACMEY